MEKRGCKFREVPGGLQGTPYLHTGDKATGPHHSGSAAGSGVDGVHRKGLSPWVRKELKSWSHPSAEEIQGTIRRCQAAERATR